MWLAGWLVLFSLRFQTYWDWTELRKFAWPPLPSLPPSPPPRHPLFICRLRTSLGGGRGWGVARYTWTDR